MLNPQSPIPLYHQLAQKLTEQILDGAYRPGDLLPSENELASCYAIGRPTVRQAMEQLVRKGMVERRRGAGTFVSEPAPDVNLFSLAGTSQAFLTKGISTEIQLLSPPRFVSRTDLSGGPFNGKSSFQLSRLVLVSGTPQILELFFFEPSLFPGFDQLNLENRSLSNLVAEHYYLKPDTGKQTFKITLVSEDQAILLGLAPGTPVLEVERILNFAGAPTGAFSRLFCRTDQFAFSQELHLGATMENTQ